MIDCYETVKVLNDINPVVKAGMMGLVMSVESDSAEVMFSSETGITYSYDGKSTFSIPLTKLASVA